MERSRITTILGIGLILVGLFLLSRSLMPPLGLGMPMPPAMPHLHVPVPPTPPLTPLLPTPLFPSMFCGLWFNPTLILLGLFVLLIWYRQRPRQTMR